MLHTPDAELYVGSRIAQIERKHFGRWFGKHALHRTHHFDQGGFQALHVVYRSRTKVISQRRRPKAVLTITECVNRSALGITMRSREQEVRALNT